MINSSRRTFLKTSFLGTSAAFSLPSFLRGFSGTVQEKVDKKPFIRRTLGRTGLSLPVVSMGVMLSDSPALVRAALDAGIIHFDTAHSYQQGRNEEMLGKVFKDVPRSSIILATKIGPEDHNRQKGTIGPGATKDAFLRRLNTSLTRLKMDYVDILYVHGLSTREEVLNSTMIDAVAEAKKVGKARFVGVSTHQGIEQVLSGAVEAKVFDVVLAGINFQYSDPKKLREITVKAAEAGVGTIAMKTMAGGYFDKEKKKPVNCKAALKWVLEDPNVTTCIPGITTFDQLAENVSVNTDINLTDEERTSLTLNSQDTGMYCDGCKQCSSTCKQSLPIPDMMRAYMYAYGYGATLQAKELLTEIVSGSKPCNDCSICTAECVRGFSLREKINDIVRLYEVPDELLA